MEDERTAGRVNPLREGLSLPRTPDPCRLVIFGATGDLTRRKLMPALYELARDGWLPGDFTLIGFSRRDRSDEEFRRMMREAVEEHGAPGGLEPEVWEGLESSIHYVRGTFDDPAGYADLAGRLAEIDRRRGGSAVRIFYLATPPSWYPVLAARLDETGLTKPQSGLDGPRLVIEKPFGRDLPSARALNRQLLERFEERRLYRIDHYLGKETVQNILVLRFANSVFEPLWNRKEIDNVQITVAEEIGIEGRGSYYEETGALRDMFQNHLLQLLCLTAMEPPSSLDADAVRDEKVKVLRSIRPLPAETVPERVVRAQYTAGRVRGREIPGYREERGVDPSSTVETFVAMRLEIDNWRWHRVPFYLRCGKRMPKRSTQISIHFRDAPGFLFPDRGREPPPEGNLLVLRIQPDEGATLRIRAKLPGPQTRVHPVLMDFGYGTAFGSEPPGAYERLLLDAMIGDTTLFTRNDEVELAWSLMDPILESWRAGTDGGPVFYAPGTWGPAEADALPARDGRSWRRP